MKVSVIDLFCGAGGLTHGLIQAGLTVSAGIDIATECRFAYEFNNNATFVDKDVKLLTKEELLNLYGNVEFRVLAGCAPCQPFSTYTTSMDKTKDVKWPLIYEFSRLIKEVSPEIITMENVPGVVKHQVYRDFYDSLLEQQYHIWAGTVDCAQYGIPQKRERHVLLASKLGDISFVEPNNEKVTVRDAIGKLPYLMDGQVCSKDPLHRASKLSKINKQRIKYSVPGGTWRDWPNVLVADCHKKVSGKGYASVYGRMEWDKPSPTITTLCYGFGNGRFGHPEQDRGLSLREAALLQTFPINYRFTESDNKISMKAVGKMIGNAVPVLLGKAIGDTIMNHLKNY
ncbi:DNA cytosine methyltransferase [Arsenophonus sp. aPb]|uniref:DNA cytosine methyltransferase n=1 Tax=Arsenophonus sp. aPb TaxID=3041619 RepID=UPI0024691CA6|nr:DNA cytosine methyltransferase [Arsenophonus sp. aPb]WGL99170.1 DNA cytosine methyltransferase [Arsenophonus sp. aPb]